MLDTLRQGATGWLAKLLMGLLVVSFMIWGVRYNQDGGGSNTMVQVAGQNVTANQYRSLFDQELKVLERQTGQTFEPQTAHQLGLDERIIGGLLVDGHARTLNLGLSDEALMARVQGQKELQGPDGKFNPVALRYALQNLQMSDSSYFEKVRRDSIREQLVGSITTGAPAPMALVDALNQFEGEQRTLDYITIPAAKVPAPAKPDDAKLKSYFDAHNEDYRAPEVRAVGVLLVSPDDFKEPGKITDDEAKGLYEGTKSQYEKLERRHVQLMSFQDKAAADKAFAALKSGKDFMAVAKLMGLADKDVDRGLIVKKDLIDSVVAEAAFKLAKDKISDPIDGALATAILRVTEIQPGNVTPFEEVKQKIKDARARELAVKGLIEMRGKIEDERAGGRALKEMPVKFPSFKYTEVALADATGNGVDGKPVTSTLPKLPAILKAGFAGDVGVETDPIDLGQDGWAWVEVKDVKATHVKNLADVKADVEKAVVDADTAAALAKLASDLSGRAAKGEDFAKLAKELGLEVKTAKDLTRTAKNADLPPAAIQLSFALAKGAVASTTALDGKSRTLLRLAAVTPAKPLDADKATAAAKRLAQSLAGSLEGQYLAGLRQSLGLTRNEALFRQMSGSAATDGGTDQ
jgi:peptidyl-prolyl cis-trans isomerase D